MFNGYDMADELQYYVYGDGLTAFAQAMAQEGSDDLLRFLCDPENLRRVREVFLEGQAADNTRQEDLGS